MRRWKCSRSRLEHAGRDRSHLSLFSCLLIRISWLDMQLNQLRRRQNDRQQRAPLAANHNTSNQIALRDNKVDNGDKQQQNN